MSVAILLHVASGALAVAAMIVAFAARKGGRLHRLGGKVFVGAMAVSLVLAVYLAVMKEDLFIGMIAVFSAFFVYTGWRLAAHRKPEVVLADRVTVWTMLVVGAGMICFGPVMLWRGDDLGVVMIVFGIAALLFGLGDLLRLKGWPTGKERLRLHVIRMGAASIATVTAPTVVNIRTEPEFIAWLTPAVILTPVIAYWSQRVAAGKVALRDAA